VNLTRPEVVNAILMSEMTRLSSDAHAGVGATV
jgi:hypothetical protein